MAFRKWQFDSPENFDFETSFKFFKWQFDLKSKVGPVIEFFVHIWYIQYLMLKHVLSFLSGENKLYSSTNTLQLVVPKFHSSGFEPLIKGSHNIFKFLAIKFKIDYVRWLNFIISNAYVDEHWCVMFSHKILTVELT